MWYYFFYLPAFVGTLAISFLLTLGSFGFDFIRFIPNSIRVLAFEPLKPNPRFAEIARFASRYIIGSAVTVTIIFMIQSLQHLSSPDDIGICMAFSMLPTLYAIIISEMFLAVVHRSFAGHNSSVSNKPISVKNAILPLVIICFAILSFCLFAYPHL